MMLVVMLSLPKHLGGLAQTLRQAQSDSTASIIATFNSFAD